MRKDKQLKYHVAFMMMMLSNFLWGATVIWTGAANDGKWSNTNNWNPKTLPTSSDDVDLQYIEGGKDILCDLSVTIKSLKLRGGSTGTNNLYIVGTKTGYSFTVTESISFDNDTINDKAKIYINNNAKCTAKNLNVFLSSQTIEISGSGGGNAPSTLTITKDISNYGYIHVRGTFTIGGKFIPEVSPGIITYSTSTCHFNGIQPVPSVQIFTQTIPQTNYANLRFSESGTKVISSGAVIGISGTFTTSTSNPSPIDNQGTFNYNGTGAQTITAFNYYHLMISGNRAGKIVTFGSDVKISQTISLTATNLTYKLTNSTVTYNGTDVQSVPNISGGYNDLICDNGAKQLTEDVIVNGSLTITNDATLQTVGKLLTIEGNFINNGVFTPTTSDIVRFTGTSPSIISGISTTPFQNLNINKTDAIVEVARYITISSQGAVTIENGTSQLNITTGSLTLLSTDGKNTARIAKIPNGSTIEGNIIAERYVPINNNVLSWWHLGSIVQDVPVKRWQDEFRISGNFIGRDSIIGSLVGTKNNWSLKTYDETQLTTGSTFAKGWKNFPVSSNTETFVNGQGYRVYVVNSITTSSPKKLSMLGKINQGDFTFPTTFTGSGVVDADGYCFLSNPYPSAIDFSHASWTKTNISNAMYVWDAQNRQWRGWVNGTPYNQGTSIIPIGQGFWVQATGSNPVLKVTEDAKTSNFEPLTRIAQVENTIEVALTSNGSDEDIVTTDIHLSELATSNYDEEYDASYLSRNMFTEFNSKSLLDICSKTTEGKKLFVNHIPISDTEIVPLVLTGTTAKEYTLTVSKQNYSIDSDVYLIDLFLNKEIKITDVTAYTFLTTSDSKSAIQNRFQVKVNNSRVLATQFSEDVNSNYIVYPNPSNGQSLTVKVTQSYTNVGLVVKDILGNTVYSELVTNINSGFEKEIKFAQKLESGVYLINFTTNNKTIIQKIVVE